MAVTDMPFRQRAVIEFLVKEGNSVGVIYERLRGVYGDVYMGTSSVRRWVKHFKDGNTDIAYQPLLQLSATSKKSTSSSDKLRPTLREKRPKKKTVILHHDNSWPHTARLTLQTI
jgi:transposase